MAGAFRSAKRVSGRDLPDSRQFCEVATSSSDTVTGEEAILRAQNHATRVWRAALSAYLAGALASCGGTTKMAQPDATGGARSGNGGRSTNDAGNSSGGSVSESGGAIGAGGSTSGGRVGSSGNAAGAAPGAGGTSSGGAPATGGMSTATGGVSTDDAGVDLCKMYGAACCVPAIREVDAHSTCTLDVLTATVDVIYEYADLEKKVASLPDQVVLSVTDADVVWAGAGPPTAARIEMRLTQAASARYGTDLQHAILHPFRLSCNGKELFIGVVYEIYGAAAIRTPVLHVAIAPNSGDVILRIGSFQGAWMGLMAGDDAESRERIDRPELRATFCQKGALHEIDPNAVPGIQ